MGRPQHWSSGSNCCRIRAHQQRASALPHCNTRAATGRPGLHSAASSTTAATRARPSLRQRLPASRRALLCLPASWESTLLRISYPVPVRLRRSRSAPYAVRKHARAAALRGYETTRHGQPPLRNTSGGAERSARAPSCMSSPGDRSPKHCRKAQSQGSTGPPPAAGAAAPSILRSPAARGAALQPLHPALPPPGCPADQARAARPCARAAPSQQPRTQAGLAFTRPAPAQALLRACSLPRCVCQQQKPNRCAPLSSRAAGFPAPTF